MHDAAEQPRRRWLVRLAALQACLVAAVLALRQPRPAAELLQHSLHPRELGYRTAKKRSCWLMKTRQTSLCWTG